MPLYLYIYVYFQASELFTFFFLHPNWYVYFKFQMTLEYGKCEIKKNRILKTRRKDTYQITGSRNVCTGIHSLGSLRTNYKNL